MPPGTQTGLHAIGVNVRRMYCRVNDVRGESSMRNAGQDGPDPIDVAVGARVRIRRRWINISQTQLAQALRITFQQIQKYERGTNRVSASMLVKIAARLETSVAALVGEDGSAPVEMVVYAQLATPGAQELLAAFAGIADGEARRAILALARSLAADVAQRSNAA